MLLYNVDMHVIMLCGHVITLGEHVIILCGHVITLGEHVIIYEMNFTLCVLLVYNDNGSVQTLCIRSVCTDPLSL